MKPQDANAKNRQDSLAASQTNRDGRQEGAERRRKRKPDNNSTTLRTSRNQRSNSAAQETRNSAPRNEARKPDLKKKERRTQDKKLYAPVSGEIIPLSSVADPVFAQKMMGDGIAFIPEGDLVVSPCYGTVAMIASAKNAVGIENDFGDQILVHIGLDTIDYNGKGIELLCQEGQKVRPGNPLVKLDRRFFDSVNADLTIPMTITNQEFGVYQMLEGDRAVAGKTPVLERR